MLALRSNKKRREINSDNDNASGGVDVDNGGDASEEKEAAGTQGSLDATGYKDGEREERVMKDDPNNIVY